METTFTTNEAADRRCAPQCGCGTACACGDNCSCRSCDGARDVSARGDQAE